MTTVAVQPPRVRATWRHYRAILDRSRTVGMFAEASRLGDVVDIRLVGHRIWLVSDPALGREIFVEKGRSVGKGEGIRLMQYVLGNGILTNEDPVSHKRNRRLINPAFAASNLQRYSEVMVAAANRAGERWHPGMVVDITDEMGRITLDVVGRTLLGDDTDRDAKAVTDAVAVVLRRFGLGLVPGMMRLLETNLPGTGQIKRAIATMRDTVARIVREHREDARDRQDIVAGLLAASEEGESLSEEQVRDETLTLMLAGFETTANALAWTWWLLDENPEVAARLRQEVDQVLGGADATYDDLTRLPYATAVVAETLRLRPPAWMLEREAKEPIELGGFAVRRGTTLLVSPWILHRDPRSWGPDAEAYRPERWLAADGSFDHAAPGQPKGAYMPFGAGSRICIGESFAWAEAVLVLATLVRRWAPATVPGQDIGMWAAVTLRPHPGIRMRLVPAPVSVPAA